MSMESDRSKEQYTQALAEVQRRTNLENSAWTLAHEMRQLRSQAEDRARQLAYDMGMAKAKDEPEAPAETTEVQ